MVEFRDVVKKYAGTDEALGVPAGTVGGIPVVTPDDLGPAAAMTPAEVVEDPDAQAALSATFAQVINPTKFGAVGDGTTDCAPAVADALASGAGVVELSPGVWRLASTIEIDRPVTIRGAGSSLTGTEAPTVLLVDEGVTGIQVQGTDATMVRVQDLDLVSAATGPGPGHGIHWLAGRPRLYAVSVRGFGGHGVFFEGGENCHLGLVEAVTCRGNHGDGFHIEGQANSHTFVQCDAMLNGGWGFWNTGRTNTFISVHTSNNTAGAVHDDSTSPFYLRPYVEPDSGDLVEFGTASHHGVWLAGHFGGSTPTNNAANGGAWVITGPTTDLAIAPNSIFVPAHGGVATSSTVTPTHVNRTPVVQFPFNDVRTFSLPMVTLPASWQAFSVHVVWANSTTNAGNVPWRVDHKFIAEGGSLTLPTTGSVSTPAAAGAQDEIVVTPRDTLIPVTSRYLLLNVARLAGGTVDAPNLLGVELRRVAYTP